MSKHGHGGARHERFDPARAAMLDDPERLEALPPQTLFSLLDAPAGARVVDFGAGTGTYAIELARQRSDLDVVALDAEPRMLDLLRAKPAAAALANLRPVSSEALPSLRGTAERVLAINVLHELDDDAMRDLVGLLKAGGKALFADWRGDIDRPTGPPRDKVYTPAEARERLARFSLEIEAETLLVYHYAIVASLKSAA